MESLLSSSKDTGSIHVYLQQPIKISKELFWPKDRLFSFIWQKAGKKLVIARFPAHAKVWAVKWIFLHLFRTTKTFTHVDYILFGQPATLGGLKRYQGFLVKDDLEKEKAEKRLSKV